MASTVLEAMSVAIYEVRAELLIFVVALCTHAVLFGSYRWKQSSGKPSKGSKLAPDAGARSAPQPQAPGAAALARTAKQLLREGAGRVALADGLVAQIKTSAVKDARPALASMLEGAGKGATAELTGAVREVLRREGRQPDQRLGEVLLRSCLASDMKKEFQEVLEEVEASEGVTPVMAVLALRSTLRGSDLEAAMQCLRRFASILKAGSGGATSATPQQIVQQLLQLAAKQAAVPALLRELVPCGFLTAWVIEAALSECAGGGSARRPQLGEVEALARTHGVELTSAAHATIVRAAGEPDDALRVLSESAKRGPVGKELLVAVLEVAAAQRHTALAEAAMEHIPKSPTLEVASALLRAVAEGPMRGQERDTAVLSAYEKYLAGVDVLGDTRTGRAVAEAALRQDRPEILGQVLGATDDSRRQVALLKSFSNEQRTADAMRVFQACPEKTVNLYNTILDTCVDCEDTEAAERIIAEAVAAGMADVVTYNTIIKKHLQRGHFQSARSVIEVMRSAGVAPNSVTFNELIDAAIRSDGQGAWILIGEMKACGVQPNSVTCSILLKSIQHASRAAEVERVLSYVDALHDAMDEVLLSSVCEACIRAGRSDLLAKQLQRQRGNKAVQVSGAQTFGSIIRAYGFLRDLPGAQEVWGQMRKRKIVPTSITIGCMVEALVNNSDPEAGLKLIHELSADPDTKPLLNAIIYCSVLKGFTHKKAFDRVWAVYEEMTREKLQFSIVTYNALIDACARAGDMSRVQSFMDGMAEQKIEPNLVTYSTILKGYCQENRLDKAFELLEAMKKSDKLRPDEITYNTLIDGCAQRGLFDQGMKLLEEMKATGVPPSTFTLSVLVKLANRGRRPEKAFELVDEISTMYRLQLNVHVYANLVHACTAHGDLPKALEVFGRMARQRVRPDVRTYTLLLRAFVGAGQARVALGLLSLAFGLRSTPLPPRLASLVAGSEATVRMGSGFPAELVTEILEASARKGGEERLAVQVCKELRTVPGLRLDPKLSLSLASHALRKPC